MVAEILFFWHLMKVLLLPVGFLTSSQLIYSLFVIAVSGKDVARACFLCHDPEVRLRRPVDDGHRTDVVTYGGAQSEKGGKIGVTP